MKKKLLFIILSILLTGSAAAWAQSEKVLIYKGEAYCYWKKHKNYYSIELQDNPDLKVPKSKARFAVFSAKNGQGWIIFEGCTSGSRDIKKGPGFQYPIKEIVPDFTHEYDDKYYPCLGKVGDWYKVRTSDGGVGYIREDTGVYWGPGGPIGKNRKPIL